MLHEAARRYSELVLGAGRARCAQARERQRVETSAALPTTLVTFFARADEPSGNAQDVSERGADAKSDALCVRYTDDPLPSCSAAIRGPTRPSTTTLVALVQDEIWAQGLDGR